LIIIDHDNFELIQLIKENIDYTRKKNSFGLIRASGVNRSNELTSLINDQKYCLFCVARNSLKKKMMMKLSFKFFDLFYLAS
jgi:hypothetical protein